MKNSWIIPHHSFSQLIWLFRISPFKAPIPWFFSRIGLKSSLNLNFPVPMASTTNFFSTISSCPWVNKETKSHRIPCAPCSTFGTTRSFNFFLIPRIFFDWQLQACRMCHSGWSVPWQRHFFGAKYYGKVVWEWKIGISGAILVM